MAALSDLDYDLVAGMGDATVGFWSAADEDRRGLAAALLEHEAEVREREVAAMEALLGFIDSDAGLIAPSDPAAARKVAAALLATGWWWEAPPAEGCHLPIADPDPPDGTQTPTPKPEGEPHEDHPRLRRQLPRRGRQRALRSRRRPLRRRGS